MEHLKTTFQIVPLDRYDEWMTINFPRPSPTRERVLEKLRRENESVVETKVEETDSCVRFYFYFQNSNGCLTASRSFEVKKKIGNCGKKKQAVNQKQKKAFVGRKANDSFGSNAPLLVSG